MPQIDSSMVAGAGGIATEFQFSSKETSFVHPKHGPGVRVTGRELIKTISPASTAPTGTTLLNWDVSPSNLLGTRVAALAQLYEKFRFKVMQFEWDPEIGSNASGKLALVYDPDCLDATPPANDAGVQAALSFANSKLTTVWKPSAIRIVEKEDLLFFTNEQPTSDPRFVFQGQFYLINGGASSLGPTGYGSVALAFELEFYKPALEQTAASNSVAVASTDNSNIRINNGAPQQMFNLLKDASATVNTNKAAGGIKQLIDEVGNTFYRTPPGNYRVSLGTQEYGLPNVSTLLASLSAPSAQAKLPPVAPAGSVAPTVTALDTPQVLFPANSAAAAGTVPIQVNTAGDYFVKAPSGADIFATLGTPVNWLSQHSGGGFGAGVYQWDIDRIIGNQAIIP